MIRAFHVFPAWGVLAAAVAGCAPEATVDVQNLTQYPPPQGPMLMLPPLLSPEVRQRDAAIQFVAGLTGQLASAGADVTADTLRGQVSARTASPDGKDPQWVSLGDLDRARLAVGVEARTICQPVVTRYGWYSRPAAMAAISDRGLTASPSPLGAASERMGQEASPGPGGLMLNGGTPFELPGYARRPLPAMPEQWAQVYVTFNIYYAASGHRIATILAANSSPDVTPQELEKGFPGRLTDAFVSTFGRRGGAMR